MFPGLFPENGGVMNNLNSILIEGNLVRDPLFRTTPKGTPLCTFSLASNRFFKQDSGLEKEVSFFDVETWSKLAENCYNLGRKGRGVRVVGRLKQERWNGADGKPHSKVAIVAEHVEFRPDFKKNGQNEADLAEEAMAGKAGTVQPNEAAELYAMEEPTVLF
jgi:single-strand DNA-binding protein